MQILKKIAVALLFVVAIAGRSGQSFAQSAAPSTATTNVSQPAVTAIPLTLDATNTIAYIPVADQPPSVANPRCVNLPGWKNNPPRFSFYDLLADGGPVDNLYKNGLRRFLEWQPFGITLNANDGWPLVQRVDDYLNLIAAHYPQYDEMISSYIPAHVQFMQSHPGCQFIAYTGASLNNPNFNGLTPAQITQRLDKSLSPFITLRMDIAFDSSSGLPANHWLFGYLTRLQSFGLHPYIEANPANVPVYKRLGFISDVTQLRNCYAPPSPAVPTGFMDPVSVRGERIGLAATRPASYKTFFAWYCKIVPRLMNSGQVDCVCLHENCFMGQGFAENHSLADLNSGMDVTRDKDYQDFLQ